MKTIIFSLLFSLSILLAIPANAEPVDISKQQAVIIATQNYPGRVLAVKLKKSFYKVKILSESGKVYVIKVDAVSGRIKSGSGSH